ncbi:hypothetical protein Sa4125_41660 [Aureimonas sp. SA4125]|nr:hypothetical protein Sa4125_41660 [Aureimonas sp. SA4125]
MRFAETAAQKTAAAPGIPEPPGIDEHQLGPHCRKGAGGSHDFKMGVTTSCKDDAGHRQAQRQMRGRPIVTAGPGVPLGVPGACEGSAISVPPTPDTKKGDARAPPSDATRPPDQVE